jgi:hypothetical protein
MKLIIAGSRSITDYNTVVNAVSVSGFPLKDLEIVCGMAKGVDLLGLEYAKRNSLKWWEFPADWTDITAKDAVIRINQNGSKYNINAGYARNIKMGQFSDALLAVWDGSSKGTNQMINWTKQNGLKVFVYNTSKLTEQVNKLDF